VAATFDRSVLIRADDFVLWVVNGRDEPWLPQAAHQNEVVGGAVAAAAIQFAEGGYTVVIDGVFFPDGVEGMSQICARRGVPIHYAVLRPDLATCSARVTNRGSGDPAAPEFAILHTRFDDLGDRETNVIEASGSAEDVAEAVLSALAAGHLSVRR
jgi:hypothetical protein